MTEYWYIGIIKLSLCLHCLRINLRKKHFKELAVVVIPIIPALRRLRQEDHKFKVGHIVRDCLKTKIKKFKIIPHIHLV
jgi:hypothetical protein